MSSMQYDKRLDDFVCTSTTDGFWAFFEASFSFASAGRTSKRRAVGDDSASDARTGLNRAKPLSYSCRIYCMPRVHSLTVQKPEMRCVPRSASQCFQKTASLA